MKNKYFVNGHTYPDSLHQSLNDSIHDTLFPAVLKGCYCWRKKSQRIFYRIYKRISYKIFYKNLLQVHRVELFRYRIMEYQQMSKQKAQFPKGESTRQDNIHYFSKYIHNKNFPSKPAQSQQMRDEDEQKSSWTLRDIKSISLYMSGQFASSVISDSL